MPKYSNTLPDDYYSGLADGLDNPAEKTPKTDRSHPHQNAEDRKPGDHPHKDMNKGNQCPP